MRDAVELATARLACQHAVRALVARYGWTVLPEEELVDTVLASIDADGWPAKLDSLVTAHYTAALYEGCRQADDPDRRERAYIELFQALYRAAHKRWPDIAREVSEHALSLVAEQIERCREPRAFLAFAMYKQLEAAKQLIQEQGTALPLPEDDEHGVPGQQPALEERLLQAERLQILLDALEQLDRRMRQAICLKFFEGLSDQDIGERLEETAGNVRVLRSRGIAQLRANAALRVYFDP